MAPGESEAMGDLKLGLALSAPCSSSAVQARMDLCPEHSLTLPNKVTELLNSPEAVMPAKRSQRIFLGNRNKC